MRSAPERAAKTNMLASPDAIYSPATVEAEQTFADAKEAIK